MSNIIYTTVIQLNNIVVKISLWISTLKKKKKKKEQYNKITKDL